MKSSSFAVIKCFNLFGEYHDLKNKKYKKG